MSIDEAIEEINTWILPYLTHNKSIQTLLDEYLKLRKEVVALACESVKRDVELAKLEAEIRCTIRKNSFCSNCNWFEYYEDNSYGCCEFREEAVRNDECCTMWMKKERGE